MKRHLILISILCLFIVCHSTAQVNQVDGGFIKDWLILGPFSGNNIDQDYLESVGGEANADPKIGNTAKTTDDKSKL
ncbi:MAG: hypothetical protein VCF25_15115 [Candidatus Poribacteria bacterium]|jgi:hypothetical protein